MWTKRRIKTYLAILLDFLAILVISLIIINVVRSAVIVSLLTCSSLTQTLEAS